MISFRFVFFVFTRICFQSRSRIKKKKKIKNKIVRAPHPSGHKLGLNHTIHKYTNIYNTYIYKFIPSYIFSHSFFLCLNFVFEVDITFLWFGNKNIESLVVVRSLESCGRLNRQLRRTLGWWERTSTLFWLLLLFAGIIFCECVANDIHNESVHVFWCYGLQIISLLLLNWTRSGREGRPSFLLSFTAIHDQSYTPGIWSWTPDVHCLQQICSQGFHIYLLESILIPAYESSVTVILSDLRDNKKCTS